MRQFPFFEIEPQRRQALKAWTRRRRELKQTGPIGLPKRSLALCVGAVEIPEPADRKGNRAEIRDGDRDERLHRENKNEQEGRGDADEKYREIFAWHAAHRLSGKMRHAACHKERDRQHIEAFDEGDAGRGRAEFKSGAKIDWKKPDDRARRRGHSDEEILSPQRLVRILEHHVEAGQPKGAGHRKKQRGHPAEALDRMEIGDEQNKNRRDAEVDEVGKRIEFRAEPRSALESPRNSAVETVEDRRARNCADRPFVEPSIARRIAVNPRQSASNVTMFGRSNRRGTGRKPRLCALQPCIAPRGLDACGPSLTGSTPLKRACRSRRGDFGNDRLAGDRARFDAHDDLRVRRQINIDARAETDEPNSLACAQVRALPREAHDPARDQTRDLHDAKWPGQAR